MHVPRSPGEVVRFGPFELDLANRLLRKNRVRIRLQAQPFLVLTALLEAPGAAVTREELRRRIWPEDTFVDFEHGLNAAVTRLRQALEDSAARPGYIETVPKYGYRFIGQLDEPEIEIRVEALPGPASRSRARLALSTMAIALAILGAVLLLLLPWNRTAPVQIRAVPLTSFRGFEANPALSPDGRYVAFTWNGEKQDNLDIYVMPIASGAPVRLTTSPAEDVSPAWSPDGRTIAFLRRLSADRGELVLVAAAGGPEHTISDTREQPWFSPRKPGAVAWSPDGAWIAAPHREPGDRSEGIYLFSLTGEKRRLTMPPPGFHSDRMPGFSPDGRALAFARLPGGFVSQICVLPLNTKLQPEGGERCLTDYKGWSAQPVWTPDGRRIFYVFGNDASKAREIRSIDVASPQAATAIVPINDEVSEIALGRHLVYSRQIEDTNIWRAELPDSGNPPVEAELLISSTWVDQTPKYSPDGKKIAFISSRSGSREVWVSNADGSNAVRMTSFNGPMTGQPSWSPDGQWIIFHARLEGTLDLFVVPAAGGPPKRLTTNSWEDHYPTYSRDGRSIFFSSRRSGEMQVWRMSREGGDAVQITKYGGVHNPAESPDGKAVFYHLPQDPGEIWRIPVQGGEPVRVAGLTQRFPVGYAVTSEGIYYGAPPHAGEERYIRFIRFSNGQDSPVILAKRPFHSGMSVSPDGRFLLFDQYDDSGSDLMLVEDFDTQKGAAATVYKPGFSALQSAP